MKNQKSSLLGSHKAKKPVKIAIVLAGGGIRGLAHIGVLEVLAEANIKIDLIVGCSAGAIAGALYGAKQDIAHSKKIGLEMTPYSKHYRLFGLPSFFKGLRGYGFFSMKKMHRFLGKALQVSCFEEMQIPLIAVATNLNEGTLKLFSKGPLAEAVCASSCIPGIFQPFLIDNTYYVDGYLLEKLPISIAKAQGAEFIIAVNVSDNIKTNIANHKPFNVVTRSLNIVSKHRIKDILPEADFVIDPGFVEVGHLFASGKQAIELYKAGKQAARKALPALQKKLLGV